MSGQYAGVSISLVRPLGVNFVCSHIGPCLDGDLKLLCLNTTYCFLSLYRIVQTCIYAACCFKGCLSMLSYSSPVPIYLDAILFVRKLKLLKNSWRLLK